MTNAHQRWETQQTIEWLINDEDAYNELNRIVRRTYSLSEAAEAIRQFVVDDGAAPGGLYESMYRPPASSWHDVDWNEVAGSFYEEDEEEEEEEEEEEDEDDDVDEEEDDEEE